jgi:hypothetical protein
MGCVSGFASDTIVGTEVRRRGSEATIGLGALKEPDGRWKDASGETRLG